MKKSLKKILLLLTVAVILVSTLPIGASAAVSDGFYVNLGFIPHSSWSSRADFPDIELAYDQLTLFYRSDKNGSWAYLSNPINKHFLYESSSGEDIRIENRSYYEMYFYLVIAGVYTFPNRYVIPAEGELILDFDVINDYVASTGITRPTTLTLWTNETCAPTYKGPVLNTNYANINVYVGNSISSVQKVYAPEGTYGSYTASLNDLYQMGLFNIADYKDGYKFDWQDYGGTIITIDPDVVNTYNVYYDIKLNTSYAIIYAETPKGTKEIARIYPSEIEDYDVTQSVTYLVQWLQNEGLLPSVVDGYQFVPSLSPDTITVDPDTVNEYTLKYVDLAADKKIVIYYYDQDSKLIKPMTYYVNSMASDFTVPQISPYIAVPNKLDLIEGVMTETFDVYCFDFQAEYDKAFEEGKSEGILISQKDLEAQLNSKFEEGYDQGFDDGYKDGSELTGKERNELMKDYNVFTGFFDGIFNSLFGAIDIILNGVAFGGVTLGAVIWTLVIVVVVVVVGGKIL